MSSIGVGDAVAVAYSVNTFIESCTTHFLQYEELKSESEKNAQCVWTLRVSLVIELGRVGDRGLLFI